MDGSGAGPLELLVLNIGRNSNFCFIVKCFIEHKLIALLFASCAVMLASLNSLMLKKHTEPFSLK